MKKIVAMLLLSVMLFQFISCADSKIKVEKGSVENGIYRNYSVGLEFAIPKDMELATEKEIINIFSSCSDIKDLTDDRSSQYVDLYALTVSGDKVVNISISYVGSYEKAMSIIEAELSSLGESYKDGRMYSVQCSDVHDFEFAGVMYRSATLAISAFGEMYIYQRVVSRYHNGCIISVVMVARSEETVGNLASAFKKPQ